MKLHEALRILNWSTKWIKWLQKYLMGKYDQVQCSYGELDNYTARHYGIYLMAEHNNSMWRADEEGCTVEYQYGPEKVRAVIGIQAKPNIPDVNAFINSLEEEKRMRYRLKDQVLYIAREDVLVDRYVCDHGEPMKIVNWEGIVFHTWPTKEEMDSIKKGDISLEEATPRRWRSRGMLHIVTPGELQEALHIVKSYIDEHGEELVGWKEYEPIAWEST